MSKPARPKLTSEHVFRGYELVDTGKHTCDLPGGFNSARREGAIIRCKECGQNWQFKHTWYLIKDWVRIEAVG